MGRLRCHCPLNKSIIFKQSCSFAYPFSALTISKYEKVISKNSVYLSVLHQTLFVKLTENEARNLCFGKQRFDFPWQKK